VNGCEKGGERKKIGKICEDTPRLRLRALNIIVDEGNDSRSCNQSFDTGHTIRTS
jgi:hypothetical protein